MNYTEQQDNDQLMSLLKGLSDYEDEQFENYPDLNPETFVFALLMQATVTYRCGSEDANFKTLIDRLSAAWALFDAFEEEEEEGDE